MLEKKYTVMLKPEHSTIEMCILFDFFVESCPIAFPPPPPFLRKRLHGCGQIQGLPTREHWKKITGMAYNKTKSKKKDELAEQARDFRYKTIFLLLGFEITSYVEEHYWQLVC